MSLRCGIVGLPNVGKSTLFNAITAKQAEAANYPFCTIEPNVGTVFVPDDRMQQIADVVKTPTLVPTTIEIVDIAGLVKGASKGEGLGNQFLSHIREVDAIVHVVRCFDDDNIIHVAGHIDPADDIATIETELMLADLDSMERRMDRLRKNVRKEKELQHQVDVAEKIIRHSEALGGISRFTFQMDNAGLSHTKLLNAIELIGKRVSPFINGV